jgi:hypothetical protein
MKDYESHENSTHVLPNVTAKINANKKMSPHDSDELERQGAHKNHT